jgi:hypothetical protein
MLYQKIKSAKIMCFFPDFQDPEFGWDLYMVQAGRQKCENYVFKFLSSYLGCNQNWLKSSCG